MPLNFVPIANIKGRSAYDIAVADGFVGSETEWVASLHELAAQDIVNSGDVAGTYVAGEEVRRIVAVEIGASAPVVTDGDLVVYYDRPGAYYYTDFSEYTTDVFPAGWSMPWQNPRPWQVLAVGDATGGKALTIDSPMGNNLLAALTLDAVDSDPDRADVELLFRTRSVGSATVLTQATGRASGGDGTETGYRLGTHSLTTLSASKYVGGTWYSTANHTIPALLADTWYMVRARLEDDTQKVKIWEDTDPEPAWQIEYTDNTITAAGSVGLLAKGMPNLQHFDWVAIATGGRTAAPQ